MAVECMFDYKVCNLSLPSSDRFQPSPRNVHPSISNGSQLLESADRGVKIIRLAASTAICNFEIYAPLCSHVLVVSARSDHHPAERIRIAVTASA